MPFYRSLTDIHAAFAADVTRPDGSAFPLAPQARHFELARQHSSDFSVLFTGSKSLADAVDDMEKRGIPFDYHWETVLTAKHLMIGKDDAAKTYTREDVRRFAVGLQAAAYRAQGYFEAMENFYHRYPGRLTMEILEFADKLIDTGTMVAGEIAVSPAGPETVEEKLLPLTALALRELQDVDFVQPDEDFNNEKSIPNGDLWAIAQRVNRRALELIQPALAASPQEILDAFQETERARDDYIPPFIKLFNDEYFGGFRDKPSHMITLEMGFLVTVAPRYAQARVKVMQTPANDSTVEPKRNVFAFPPRKPACEP